MERIKCIIKRPDEKYGHMTNISCSLKNLQKTVEGYIEAIMLRDDLVIICNEEGKIKGLQPNFRIGTGWLADTVCGTVIVIGVNEDEFTDLPISFADWKRILKGWGN